MEKRKESSYYRTLIRTLSVIGDVCQIYRLTAHSTAANFTFVILYLQWFGVVACNFHCPRALCG